MQISRKSIIEAKSRGDLLAEISRLSCDGRESREELASALAKLHNEGTIDIIVELMKLKRSSRDFFLTKHTIEMLLPKLNAPVRETMLCVSYLTSEAGADMTAGSLYSPFIDYCSAEPSRFSEALSLVKDISVGLTTFLTPVLTGGFKIDPNHYLSEALWLSNNENPDIRSNAIYALGRIQHPDNQEVSTKSMHCLVEVTKKESVDIVLASIIKSACAITISNNALITDGLDCLESALSKGADLAIHSASEVFFYDSQKLPEAVLDVILAHLPRVNSDNTGTINNIDMGMMAFLGRKDPEKGIQLLENILKTQTANFSMDSFDSAIHAIHEKGGLLLSKILTKWFLTGDLALCEGVMSIVRATHDESLLIEIDKNELPDTDFNHLLFIARKTIGYLFTKPAICASIIVSLMKLAQDQQTLHELSKLLFDPILINYTGETCQFLEATIKNERGKIRKAIQATLDAHEGYLQTLRSIPNIPELYPSQEQREINGRRVNRLMAKSYKEAMKESIFGQLCSKSVLLYGASSINHIQEGPGKSRRMEIPMQSYETSFELPRQEAIDPFGLDYALRIFRVERFIAS